MDSVDSTRAKSLDSAPPSARIEYSGSTPTSTTTGYHQVPPESSVGEYAARYATEQYGTIARLAHFGFNFGLFFWSFLSNFLLFVSVWESGTLDFQKTGVAGERNYELDFKDLEIGKELGAGNFATVFLGSYNGFAVAIKKLTNQNDAEAFNGKQFFFYFEKKNSSFKKNKK